MIGDLVSGIVGAILGETIGAKLVGKKRDKFRERSLVVCTLRVVEGEYAPIGPRWSPGRAQLSHGMIAFKRHFRPQTIPIPVRRIEESDTRTPKGLEIWWVDPDATIVRVTTPGAVLEWAVSSPQFAWAVETVAAGL